MDKFHIHLAQPFSKTNPVSTTTGKSAIQAHATGVLDLNTRTVYGETGAAAVLDTYQTC